MTKQEAIEVLQFEIELNEKYIKTARQEEVIEALNMAIEALREPRENVVEVIHCKDCVRWMDRSGRTGYCEEHDLRSNEEFYCAYGTTTCPHFYKGYCGKFEDGCFHQCKENKEKMTEN